MRLKRILLIGMIGVLSLGLLSCNDDPAASAGEVINAFGASCSSNGPWSQQARIQTDSLIQIFENLKNKDECSRVSSLLDSLHGLALNVHGAYGNTAYLDYRQGQEELQELMLSLSSASDPGLILALKAEIIDRQVGLASLRAQKASYEEGRDRIGYQDQYSVTTASIGSSFSSLFDQAGALSSCLQQSPSTVISLFSNLATVAGSFASPMLGSNMQMISGMLSTFLNYTRRAKIDSSIWDLHRSKMPQALTCGLESMTSFYCQAEDASEMVSLQADSYEPNEPPDNFWTGIDLVSRRLPVLNNWLLKVRSGVKPQNEEDAGKMTRVLEKRLKLDTVDLKVQGILNDVIRKFSRTNDTVLKDQILSQTIKDLSLSLSGSMSGPSHGTKDPFVELTQNPKLYACWLVQGNKVNCETENGVTNPDINFEPYIDSLIKLRVSVDQIQRENWIFILDKATKQVLLEFNDIIFINPELLIAAANEGSARHESPRQSLILIRGFVLDFLAQSREKAPSRVPVIESTLEIIDEVLATIDNYLISRGGGDPSEPDNPPADPGEPENPNDPPTDPENPSDPEPKDPPEDEVNPLAQIYTLFRLDLGTQFFSERIAQFVEWDLVDHLDAGDIPEDISEILKGANGEILHRLTASGFQDLLSVKNDLNMARMQSEDNYTVFRDFMDDEIIKVINKLDERSRLRDDPDAGFDRIYGQSLAHLCALVFATGNWPDKDTRRICRKSVLYGPNSDDSDKYKIEVGRLENAINEIVNPQVKQRKKVCAYYNFLRANRIAEIVRERRGMSDNDILGLMLESEDVK